MQHNIMSTAFMYTIQSGDTLTTIAAQINGSAGITYQQIEAANPGINPNGLQIGQAIDIPPTTGAVTWKYVILSGDTLSNIADGINAATGTTVETIEAANPSVNPNNLQIGSTLNIPASGVALPPIVPAKNIGYWCKTWDPTVAVPGATMGIAFSGWADIPTAIQESSKVKHLLMGDKYICIGGGNKNGKFTTRVLTNINNAAANGDFAGYDGIAYDIEDATFGIHEDFSESFKAVKAAGFKVLVSVSHSAPYGAPDAGYLMGCLLDDENVDFMSPQLYTNGDETENDYADTLYPWVGYVGKKAALIPSIVTANLYPSAVDYFNGQNITLEGYIQWANIG